jgi:hypothetical protein
MVRKKGEMKGLTLLAIAVLVAWAGCATPPEEEAGVKSVGGTSVEPLVACERSEGRLSPGASLAGLDGSFTLTMVEAAGRERSISGSLVLMEQSEGLERWDQVATPMYGTAEIALEAVGAVEVGELSNADPTSPGVIVMEDDGPEGRRIRLRFGSRANTRGTMAFDGGFTIFTVREITAGGFAGGWRSAARGPAVEGWFCVRRAPSTP